MSVSEPGKIITPWAEAGLKNAIPPAANPATGRAGFDQGFSAINMTAKEAGGIPPFGQDFNGIFYEVTNILRYMQAGGQPTFNAALATAIGGYPKGAMVLGDDGVAIYTNRVDGNSANPNSGGSGWAREDLMLREALRRSYAEAGWLLETGSCEAGATLTSAQSVVLYEANGNAYSHAGPYPYAVSADTDPTTGGFVDRSGELLRPDVEMLRTDVDSLIQDVYGSKLNSAFSQKMMLEVDDVCVLLQGDSTGDADDEWYRLMIGSLSTEFPTHTFLYKKWNGTSWPTSQTISTGTGARSVTFYNGSVGGATPGYWAGSRKTLAYDGRTFDVIFTSYGLNVPTQFNAQAERHAEQLLTLKNDHPLAQIISCIQPVDYNLKDRSALRGAAQRFVNDAYGIKTIDVMRLFLDLVKSTGGSYAPWYSDGLHPNAAGSAKWSSLALSAMLSDKGDARSIEAETYARACLPNSAFESFLGGPSTTPDFYGTNGCTVAKDTTVYETFGQSVKAFGINGTVGTIFSSLSNEIVSRLQHLPYFVIAVRVWSNSPSETGGKVFFAHSVSTAYTEIASSQAPSTDVDGGFRWSFLKVDKQWYRGLSDFRIGVYTGSNTSQYVYIDRIIISPSIVINDVMDTGYVYSIIKSSDKFTMTAGQKTFRNFTDTNVRPGMFIKPSMYPSAGDVVINAHCNAAGVITLEYSNPSVGGVALPDNSVRFNISV